MRGTEFSEANTKLLPPEGQEDRVYPLHIWYDPDMGLVISKWRMTWKERLSCLFQGHIWLHVEGRTHPPVTIETFYPFQKTGLQWTPLVVKFALAGMIAGFIVWVLSQLAVYQVMMNGIEVFLK